MKILYHHRTLGDGAEGIHVREMVGAFRALSHEVKVIGPVGEATPAMSSKARILDRVKKALPAIFYEFLELFYTGYCFCKTTVEIKRFRPDLIYDRYIIFNAGNALAAKLQRVPLCLEVNAPLALERSSEPDERLVLKGIASAMERWICASSSRTIVVSSPLRDYLESIGVPRGHCIVMPNGVNPERFTPRAKDPTLREQLGVSPHHVVIGFSGVIRAWHGLDLLVQAVGELAAQGVPAFLLVVGDGPYRLQLEEMVQKFGLERSFAITGRVAHERVPDYVALFDIAVSPRATFYASPMKVIEYMALAKPVVVPRTANFLDIIDENVNGAAFSEGDATALAKTLKSLCDDPEGRRAMGASAAQKVVVRLNWLWNAREVCRLFGLERTGERRGGQSAEWRHERGR
jgi:glycosyltransferase involved in cell wall biosynthesis